MSYSRRSTIGTIGAAMLSTIWRRLVFLMRLILIVLVLLTSSLTTTTISTRTRTSTSTTCSNTVQALPSIIVPPRHVCLLDSYSAVRGPYFTALLDQLVERAVVVGQEEDQDEPYYDDDDDENGYTNNNNNNIRMVFCYYNNNNNNNSSAGRLKIKDNTDNHDDDNVDDNMLGEMIRDDFGIPSSCFHTVALEDYNPITLQEQFQEWQPTVVWVSGGGAGAGAAGGGTSSLSSSSSSSKNNAFGLRYKMRTSGLDRWIHHNCGGPGTTTKKKKTPACVYVGEGAGALCAGASLRVAHYYPEPLDGPGHDPKGAPEPQFFGLGLLGPDRTVAFTTRESIRRVMMLDANSSTSTTSNSPSGLQLRSSHPDLAASKLTLLEQDQVYVWSQSSESADDDDSESSSSSVASFVFLAAQRGMMEQMSSPKPLPPLVDDYDDDNDDVSSSKKEGVDCFGEPSVDPSRQMQSIGDSEWFEESSLE